MINTGIHSYANVSSLAHNVQDHLKILNFLQITQPQYSVLELFTELNI